MYKKILCILSVLALQLPQNSNSDDKKAPVFDLDEIVVTATRYPVKLKDVSSVVTVITKDEIENSGAKKVSDVLDKSAGVDITSFGSVGALSEVNIRGALSSQVLVLLDGRPINSPSSGTANLAEIPVDNIEKIEVVRGPVSALYGSNAIGGVVNIITKSPYEKFTTKIDTSYGTYNTQIYKIENGYKFNNLGYLLTANKNISNGARANSNYDGIDLTGKFEYKLDKEIKILLTGAFHQDELGLPGSQPAEDIKKRTSTQKKFGNDEVSSLVDKQKDKKGYIDLSSEIKLSKQSELLPKVYAETSKLDYHSEYVSSGKTFNEDDIYKTDVFGIDLPYRDYGIIDNQIITFGVNLREEQFNADTTNTNLSNNTSTVTKWQPKVTIKAVYVEDEIELTDKLTTLLGVRYDYHSVFKGEASPRLSAIYKLGDTSLKASVGKAFKSPTLNDIYWPERATDRGNPDLIPETAWAYEVGIETVLSNSLFGRVNLFRKDIKDMIAWAPTGPMGAFGPKWQPSNVNKLTNQGIELELKTNLPYGFTANIGYTFIDAKQLNRELINATTNEMKEETRTAFNTPQNQVTCNIGHETDFGLMTNINGRYTDKRLNYYANYTNFPEVSMDTKEIPAYFIADLKLTQKISEYLKLFISINNVFDVKYIERFGSSIDDKDYPLPGRIYTGGISLTF